MKKGSLSKKKYSIVFENKKYFVAFHENKFYQKKKLITCFTDYSSPKCYFVFISASFTFY